MRKGNLAEFFAASLLVGSDLKIERVKGGLREIDLEASSTGAGGRDEGPRMGSNSSAPDPRRGKC
jgi:hypothetical protein